MNRECYLFDLDGTLADCSHRLRFIQTSPKDWDSFFRECWRDEPIAHVVDVCHRLSINTQIVYVSGRSDVCRSETLWWLERHALPEGPLYMRKAGDFRADDIVKLELLERIKSDGWMPLMAFDDRDRVVKAWRSVGIPCAQVAEGDF